jgi:hypothetical protein
MTSYRTNLKCQLATESLFALMRLRKTGQRPTHEDSPVLMDLWKWMLYRIMTSGNINECRICAGYQKLGAGRTFRFSVTALWDDENRLSKFLVYEVVSGSLLLAGDMNGPVFPARKPSAVHAAIENQNEAKDIS